MSLRLPQPDPFFPQLASYLENAAGEFELIPPARQNELRQLAAYIETKLQAGQPVWLNYICTHNSRRSHLGQIWGQIAAWFYRLPSISTFSGGTEATAFNPRAVTALRTVGCQITAIDPDTPNPRYLVSAGPELPSLECFSKRFDEYPNPASNFCAVMTCTQADEACPLVPGCELRLPIRYDDPKVADDTPDEANRYLERSRQVCREMLFAMSQIV